MIRRVNFTSQLQKVLYEVTPATACKVCPSLALVSSLRRSTEETNGVQWPYNSRVTVSRSWNTRSPLIPVIVKRPRYVAIKKRTLSFKIYPPPRVSRITAVLLRFAGQYTGLRVQKNRFAGSSLLFRGIVDVTLTTEVVFLRGQSLKLAK